MLWRMLLLALAVYFLFRLIFDFIIPVYRATKQVKKEFGKMQEQMDGFMKSQQSADHNASPGKNKEEKNDKPGDYIDFEEVK